MIARRPRLRGNFVTLAFLLLFTGARLVLAQFLYSTNNGSIVITGYNGQGGPVEIPGVINGMPVTGIADRAFKDAASITSVLIPGSVADIGSETFANCTALSHVTIPTGIKTIAFATFSNCGALQEIVLPNSVTNIGNYAFSFCGLTNLRLPNGLISIGNVAFGNCESLTRVTVPPLVVSVGVYAFSSCTALVGAYFEGDRPFFGSDAFINANQATIYYAAGAKGWGSSVAGRPAAVWNPTIVIDDKFGIAGDQFGFTISGSQGVVVIVEAAETLSGPTWTSVGTNTLTGTPFYFKIPRSLDSNIFFRLRAP